MPNPGPGSSLALFEAPLPDRAELGREKGWGCSDTAVSKPTPHGPRGHLCFQVLVAAIFSRLRADPSPPRERRRERRSRASIPVCRRKPYGSFRHVSNGSGVPKRDEMTTGPSCPSIGRRALHAMQWDGCYAFSNASKTSRSRHQQPSRWFHPQTANRHVRVCGVELERGCWPYAPPCRFSGRGP